MKKYSVRFYFHTYGEVTVCAKNKKQAIKKADPGEIKDEELLENLIDEDFEPTVELIEENPEEASNEMIINETHCNLVQIGLNLAKELSDEDDNVSFYNYLINPDEKKVEFSFDKNDKQFREDISFLCLKVGWNIDMVDYLEQEEE